LQDGQELRRVLPRIAPRVLDAGIHPRDLRAGPLPEDLLRWSMPNKKLTKYFQGAVLAALALPAGCTGKVDETVPPTIHPPASCGLTTSSTGECAWSFTFTGDATTCVGFAAATGTPEQCLAACGTNNAGDAPSSCSVSWPPAPDGMQTLFCSVNDSTTCPAFPPGNGGRRPEYFASIGFGHAPAGREVGTHFARVACMEAGSVEAFRALRDEIVAHGAPRRLVRAASRAMRDELRHVRQTSALARRFGEEPVASPPPPPRPPRPLSAIARENAVEGCVRETFSALECAWQAARSADPVVRATMARIAADEMRHLELSWEVHRWALSRLGRAEREAIRTAQRDEIAALEREVAEDPPASVVRVVGLPRAFQSRALIGAIAAAC
jgi:hypothetical protein